MSATARCSACAKEFEGQPWRVACDRCGDRVVRMAADLLAFVKAPKRAFLAGWTAKGKVRNKALATQRRKGVAALESVA